MVGTMNVMTRRDARSLDHRTLEEMRRMAVKAVLGGESQRAVARRFEVHHQTVCKWMNWYRTYGDGGLESTTAPGPEPKLSDRQVEIVRRIIIGKDPRQLSFGAAFWTLRLVGTVIERRFNVVLHETTIARLLRRIGITPQKPIRRAFQRDDADCRRWMKEQFPEIVRLAQRRQATLLFLDETGIHEDQPVGRTWGERGQTPVVRVSGTRRRSNVISAISARGRLWFRCFGGTLTAARYQEFVQLLLQDIRGEIVLIHDRHPAHVAASTRRFFKSLGRRVAVFELPSYAPDLNPDEHVWAYLKGCFRSEPLDADEDFASSVQATMESIASDSKLVRSFFDHPAVKYVKDAISW
jgi:transposase